MKILTQVSLLFFSLPGVAPAAQLITNGGFETGSFASGWTVTNEAGGAGNFYVDTVALSPVTGLVTAGPATGHDYAISDESGPAADILSQSFTVPVGISSVTLSYSLFVNSYGGDFTNNGPTLDYNAILSQYARVDILTSSASLFSASAGVLENFYNGTDLIAGSNPYTNYSYNITSLVGSGGTFVLRFAAVSDVSTLNVGIDNVSIVTTTGSTVPEPSTIGFMILGAGLLVAGYKAKSAQTTV